MCPVPEKRTPSRPRQTTTMRIDPAVLQTARYLLNREDRSVTAFCEEALRQYVLERLDQVDGEALRTTLRARLEPRRDAEARDRR